MIRTIAQIANFMGPTWGPPGSSRHPMGPKVAPWCLLSGWRYTSTSHVYAKGAADIFNAWMNNTPSKRQWHQAWEISIQWHLTWELTIILNDGLKFLVSLGWRHTSSWRFTGYSTNRSIFHEAEQQKHTKAPHQCFCEVNRRGLVLSPHKKHFDVLWICTLYYYDVKWAPWRFKPLARWTFYSTAWRPEDSTHKGPLYPKEGRHKCWLIYIACAVQCTFVYNMVKEIVIQQIIYKTTVTRICYCYVKLLKESDCIILNYITVTSRERHGVWNQRHSDCLFIS